MNKEYQGQIARVRRLGFDFIHIWFHHGKLSVKSFEEPKEKRIKALSFPILLHAVLDINDFEKHGQRLLELLVF